MYFSRIVACAAVLFALNFGYSFATPLVGGLLSAYKSQSWPQANGTVVSAEVKQDRKGRPYALVEYTYPVAGQAYQSSRISFMGLGGGASSAHELVAGYAANTGVTVFFNPDDPSESVLRPGLHTYIPLLILAVGLLVVGSTLVTLFRVLRRAKRASSADAPPPSVH